MKKEELKKELLKVKQKLVALSLASSLMFFPGCSNSQNEESQPLCKANEEGIITEHYHFMGDISGKTIIIRECDGMGISISEDKENITVDFENTTLFFFLNGMMYANTYEDMMNLERTALEEGAILLDNRVLKID